ncbi:fimbrial protein [Pluralibacter sp.]|uniref:fimbrial protein n=1 Tax=Pluralibacter sp. TaxID=1920032 RepID=UPI0025F705D9|nr:fimbrial protein [Pluralibacter sp.]MBV8042161.1 type 1 fimbrial protein [Pluralibacter sp.]
MNKLFLFIVLATGNLLAANYAQANYIADVQYHTMTYDLGPLDIPASVGDTSSYGWHDNSSIAYTVWTSDGTQSYMELSLNGTLLGDGVTWATSNPGIGIQYKLDPQDGLFTPDYSTTAPTYRVSLTDYGTSLYTYVHLRYRLVRLLAKVPPGQITFAPDVTLHVYNPDGLGGDSSGLILSGIASQPKLVACTINAPAEIKLPPLYGNNLTSGAMNVTDAPTISLTNCPGAINNITYNFSAVYGTHNAANGELNTVTGEGYAEGVYIQIQNEDGSAHIVNGGIDLGYTGSGDYTIPPFKVAYYIDDPASVTVGNVKSAIQFILSYN